MKKTADIENFISPDQLATRIAELYRNWEMDREPRLRRWKEVQEYVFSVDTTTTANSQLEWSNKTTLPKLCQIRDNLYANYMATLFPKRKWLSWVGDTMNDASSDKKEVIESYMVWAVDRPAFYREAAKLISDYIDYGNYFAVVEWTDDRVGDPERNQTGYVGPTFRRISPLDVVMDPTASDFKHTPKIIRSFVSMGQIKKIIDSQVEDEETREKANALWDYFTNYRKEAGSYEGELVYKNRIYEINGLTSYREYLSMNTVEVLTFYGDLYDEENDELLENYCIQIVDRHKIIYKEPVRGVASVPPIFHGGWRIQPDSLWAMGPLENIVGMQYRIDHLENMKADVFDLIAYPPVKIRGFVEPFEWKPLEQITIGDDGDVELLSPDVQTLQADTQIAILEQKMEEMAGSPREAMGFRSPGEKTKYEVQVLENASSRIFQSKTAQFERDGLEDILNGMLELARTNMTPTTVRVFDEEVKANIFLQVTPEELVGAGRIRPIAARNFAEKANVLQNLTNFANSALAQDPNVRVHFSGERIARMLEEVMDISEYDIVSPYIGISEQVEQQRIAQFAQEELMMESQTPTGLAPDDFDEDLNLEDTPPVEVQ